ncbi:MAG: hypothetical protein KBA86_02695 [Bacteroidales bacterium]|nr:hypothetical protein [Bacteroidales bacterium]
MYLRSLNNIVFLIFFIPIYINAQIDVRLQADIGKNNLSLHAFSNAAVMTSFYFTKNTFSIGSQLTISDNPLPAFYINYTRNIEIYKQKFDLKAFYTFDMFSEKLYEINRGLLAGYILPHFTFKIGTNFRTYRIFTNSDSTINENFNFMYLVTYYINSPASNWNVGITLTNFDFFLINQETNPMFNIETFYTITPHLKVLFEAWYISSGALNLSVNPFGFYFRTACVCNINY